MRALIVGAGQVGVVIAHHLCRGGAEVSFFVREKHAAETKRGFALYSLKIGTRHPLAERLDGVPVLTAWDEAAEHPWDWVVLSIPSPGLREPGFIEGLVRVATGKTQVVGLVLGLGDLDWLEQHLGPRRLCCGAINIISFAVPLGWLQPTAPGTAYFFPPGSAFGFSGSDPAALGELVKVACRGGLPARVSVRPGSRLPDALLFALVSALELVGWQFSGLAGGEALRLSLDAAREREEILAARGGAPVPTLLKLVSPTMIRLLLWVFAAVLPFPLEEFLRVHFTKVNSQFEQERRRLLTASAAQGISSTQLAALNERLRQRLGA